MVFDSRNRLTQSHTHDKGGGVDLLMDGCRCVLCIMLVKVFQLQAKESWLMYTKQWLLRQSTVYKSGMEWNIEFRPKVKHWDPLVIQRGI